MSKNSIYYRAPEIADLLEISERKAYDVIGKLNRELKAMGYEIIGGRVPKKYFHRRYDLDMDQIEKQLKTLCTERV